MKKWIVSIIFSTLLVFIVSITQAKNTDLKLDTSSWIYCIDRPGQKWCTSDSSYVDGKWWLQSDYGPGWGALQNDIWSSDKDEYLPHISRYILCPTNYNVWRDQSFIMDDNQFSIPILTNTYMGLSQVCWYKVTKMSNLFDGIKIDTNITSNVTFDIFKEITHGKFEHLDTSEITLDHNQSFYILIRSSQWYPGKVDMIKLVSYNENDWKLNTGYKILIVSGSIVLLVIIVGIIVVFFARRNRKKLDLPTVSDESRIMPLNEDIKALNYSSQASASISNKSKSEENKTFSHSTDM